MTGVCLIGFGVKAGGGGGALMMLLFESYGLSGGVVMLTLTSLAGFWNKNKRRMAEMGISVKSRIVMTPSLVKRR